MRALAALLVILIDGAAVSRAAAMTPTELADFDVKADYAFYTEDGRALERLVAGGQGLAAAARPIERYQYAHAQLRVLQVALRQHRPKDAEAAANVCIEVLERANDDDAGFAEGHILEGTCAGYLSAVGGLRGLAAARRSESRLAAAKAVAPANPRLLLATALTRWYRSEAADAERRIAREAFEHAAAAFDAVVGEPTPGDPSWGAAEAWLFVGIDLEESDDYIGARNAYEKSLLIAPEFAAARRRLAALAARP